MSANNQTAVITGASSGIGLGLAEAFLRHGYNVVGNARSQERLETAAKQLNASSRFVTVSGDIAKPETSKKLFARAVEAFGGVDVLVNNAGIFAVKPFIDFTQDDLELQLATNLKGVFYTSQEAARHMIPRKRGHIINITAAIAIQPNINVPALLAVLIKGGINQATRALALELSPHNIQVNAVAPGIVDTAMHPAETHGFLNGLQPAGRIATVDEVADAVLYLAKADYTTGVILPVDGGWTAGNK